MVKSNAMHDGTTTVSSIQQPNTKPTYPHSSSTFSLDKNEEFNFIKPPECPVFKPNEEEFKNPLVYIGKIKSIAEKYGIAKIQPPKSWTPPFALDVDKIKFTPRVQRLNELEAKTRVKLNFLDQIAKFWELQGSSLKIPMVERKALDLYTLHRMVQQEGGIEHVTKERKWSKIAHSMGYPFGKSIGTTLKTHYERILHPFDIFTSGKAIDIKLETECEDQEYKQHGIESRQQISPPNETTARRSKRFANAKHATCGLNSNINNKSEASSPVPPNKDDPDESKIKSSILKDEVKEEVEVKAETKLETRSETKKSPYKDYTRCSVDTNMKRKMKKNDPLAQYICHFCNRGDAEENLLLCDGCDDSYHTFCLMPPLNDIPKGDWRCPKCVVEEVSKPQEAFGFEQAQREYTLQQFGEMADQFKADYFNMAVHLVPIDLVEREFWRIVSSIDEDVTVEYGADLHTMDHGSGFPTKSSLYLLPGDQEYSESSWNLNNLPILEESILGHINADISGMKVPWMYVGMCFATFCWHNEDHWSYSINYLHWGEPKTWYGVPGSKAEIFEETMKSTAPELFHSQPDLLHQLVTIMNPNILMKNNIPVYRTDQNAGEFVITFPRAYHAGFNQGYNFAEAVNFAPADWIKMGRECINHYSNLRRFCVFSHDELVCKMSLNSDKLNLGIATACYLDMVEMVDTEKKLRKSLLEWGVTKAEREAFELIPDDERQCHTCKTTCFLSAVTCTCTKAIVCLRHYSDLCGCPPDKHTLQYRYTLDELPLMLKKLKVKADTFESWLSKVRDVLDPNTLTTISLEELQNLATEAEEKKFPASVILERLNSAVLEAEKCVTVIEQLEINKIRVRTRNLVESTKYKLTMDELNLFVQEIDNLCCIIPGGQSVRDLQKLGHEFIETSKIFLAKKLNKINETDLENLIEEGSILCIDLHELEKLRCKKEQLKWYNKVKEYKETNKKIPLNEIKSFLEEGLNIVPDTLIDKEINYLKNVILDIESWEEVAKKCFESGTQHDLPEIEVLLERANDIDGILQTETTLREAVKKAKDWLNNVETLKSNENYPYLNTLEQIVNRGKNIPFHLEELKQMEEHLEAAKNWIAKTAKTFLKEQTNFQLLDVLMPRSEAVMIGIRNKKKTTEEQFTEFMTPQQMVNQFKIAEEKEILDMRQLRKLNSEKNILEDKFCICKRKFNGTMFNCILCKDWFHETCVPPPKSSSINSSNRKTEIKFLCCSCMRSRRPRLETILKLLVSLQHLPIRIPEGEALQCLTERAMNWQDRTRNILASQPYIQLIEKLSNESKQNENSKTVSSKDEENSNKNKKKLSGKMNKKDKISTEDDINSTTSLLLPKMDHAYSVIPPGGKNLNLVTSLDDLAQLNSNRTELDKNMILRLDELMMEGDLLEVSLDETMQLWKILNLVNQPTVKTNPMTDKSNLSKQICHPADQYQTENLVNNTISVIKQLPKSGILQDQMTNKIKRGRKIKKIGGGKKSLGRNNGVGSGGGLTTAENNGSNCDNMNEFEDGTGLITTTTTPNNSENLIGSNKKSSLTGKKRKRFTSNIKSNKKSLTTNNLQTNQDNLAIGSSIANTSTSDEDEECSAYNCAKPSGREVDWVQCDGGCNKWFHMFCVGLDKNQIKLDDDYICKLCKKNSPTGDKQASTSTTTIVNPLSSTTVLTETTINSKNTSKSIINSNIIDSSNIVGLN